MNKVLKNIVGRENSYFSAGIVVLTIYYVVMFYFCVRTDAVVPDEIWFYNITVDLKLNSFKDILHVENYLGYGYTG